MFDAGISEPTKRVFGAVAKTGFVKQYYLAGGTALALRLGHRLSVDLDFFALKSVEPRVIIDELKNRGDLTIIQNNPGTFNGKLDEVKISFFRYPYSLVEVTGDYLGVKVAGIKDIAAMKVDAVGSRGTKRDFVDMYFILKQWDIVEVLKWYSMKYRQLNIARAHTLKSLVYFEDAEGEVMPNMLIPVEWEEVKAFMQKEVKRLAVEWRLVG